MPNTRIKVLFVDDDEDEYILTRDLLSGVGEIKYDLEWVATYDIALERILQQNHDVYLLDYYLGEQTGLDLLQEAVRRGCDGPFILLTGQGSHEVDVQAMKVGVSDYLVKDQMSAPLLERSLRYAIERKKTERENQRREVQNQHTKKLEAVGSLAAGIAHEINTPIQFVGDNTRFLADAFETLMNLLEHHRNLLQGVETDDHLSAVSEELTKAETEADFEYFKQEIPLAVSQTLEGVERVSTIVRAMKDFSHPDKGEKSLSDLNKALQTTLTVARNELKYVADVVTDFDKDLPFVWCHVGELNQVFLNLLVNSAHSIAEVVGQSSENKGTITVRTRVEGDYVQISIADTGKGIPEEIHDKIFEPFFTTKDVGKGTGQGLAIARSVIVDKHDGSITFESEVGRGTTFYIRLPVSKESSVHDKEEDLICRR
jgi:signal transduction histidine kinase